MAMHLMPGSAVFERRLGAVPLATYEAGETVLAAGSRTGRLLILKSGKVSIVKESIEIAKVAEPGAVFAELSALLHQPHTADVWALEASQFHVAEAAALLGGDRSALLYIADAHDARRLGVKLLTAQVLSDWHGRALFATGGSAMGLSTTNAWLQGAAA
jgi:CRP/FNR family transcriptional regulator, cyclic AMP receptor protein